MLSREKYTEGRDDYSIIPRRWWKNREMKWKREGRNTQLHADLADDPWRRRRSVAKVGGESVSVGKQ